MAGDRKRQSAVGSRQSKDGRSEAESASPRPDGDGAAADTRLPTADDRLPQANIDDVAAALKDAAATDRMMAIGQDDPPPGGKIDGIEPGRWTPDEWGLPPGCPVLPLGTDNGVYFFLDTIGQLRALKESEFGQAGLNSLFAGRHLWLYWAFPKRVEGEGVKSWRPEKVREALMGACARKGAWNPFNRVRGRGLWKGRDGRLILHCGDRLVTAHGEEDLGEMEGMVYPTGPALPKPWPVRLAGKRGPAAKLLPHLASWEWERPKLDPLLYLGWIGVGFLGPALANRPGSYVLGDRATGKSSLHNDTKAILDDWLINTGDATAAGIYQLLRFDGLPVAIDEFEAKADNRKAKAVVELMRLSFSGAPMNRGGDSHKGTQFHGRSAFTFSSINRPAMEPQDLSRLVFLRLKRLPEGKAKPIIPDHELAELGRKILRRLVDEWHRFPATLNAWREFLASCGHDGRGQDTFGTLMAVADLIVADDAVELDLEIGPNAESYESWRPLLSAAGLAELEDMTDNWRLCLTHLLSQRIEAWRGGTRHTVGEVLTEFWERDVADLNAISFEQARKLLEQTGLTIKKPANLEQHYTLFVPNQHTLLHTLFKDSKWQGELAAGTWAGALRQAPETLWKEGSARINGSKFKGTEFALKDIIVSEEEGKRR